MVRWIAADVCGSCLLSSQCQIFAFSLGFPCPSNPAGRVVIAQPLLSAHRCDSLAPCMATVAADSAVLSMMVLLLR